MESNSNAVRLAEDISILSLLHQVAVPPTSNPVTPRCSNPPEDYALPFEKERHLTIVLAYLSCIKDNPNRVPALCVKENRDANCLDVLVTVNASNASDSGALKEIGAQFQKLFRVLPLVSTSDDAEQKILTEIVSMCSPRIIERLRFNNPGGKTPVEEHLSDAIRILSNTSMTFTTAAKDLIRKISLWKKHRTTSELAKVVESAYQVSKVPDLPSLLDHISNKDMAPCSRKSIFNSLAKLARYKKAATVLYRTAKQFPIARKMQFIAARLPNIAFERVPENRQARGRDLSSAIARTSLSKSEQNKMALCYGYLKMNPEKADQQFRQQKTQTLDKAKIHAEVQLVFYCETNKFRPPPRVISSSKDACFLCNSFINMHGKYHIPRQHGRVYPSWRLPCFPAPNKMESQFATQLESLIGDSVRTMIRTQSRINHPSPNESTALTIASTETTVSADGGIYSVPSSGRSTGKVHMPQPCPLRSPGDVDTPCVSLVAFDTPSLAIVEKEMHESNPEPKKGKEKAEEGLKPTSPPEERLLPISSNKGPQVLPEPCAKPRNPTRLIQGLAQVIKVEANSVSGFYKGRSLELEIEYSATGPADSNDSSNVSCTLEWLSSADVSAIRADNDALIINAEELEGEISVPSITLRNCYIASKETVFRVRIQ